MDEYEFVSYLINAVILVLLFSSFIFILSIKYKSEKPFIVDFLKDNKVRIFDNQNNDGYEVFRSSLYEKAEFDYTLVVSITKSLNLSKICEIINQFTEKIDDKTTEVLFVVKESAFVEEIKQMRISNFQIVVNNEDSDVHPWFLGGSQSKGEKCIFISTDTCYNTEKLIENALSYPAFFVSNSLRQQIILKDFDLQTNIIALKRGIIQSVFKTMIRPFSKTFSTELFLLLNKLNIPFYRHEVSAKESYSEQIFSLINQILSFEVLLSGLFRHVSNKGR